MKIGMMTGSFDPITLGHIALLDKALSEYDKVYIALLVNPDKRYTFALSDRLALVKAAIAGRDNVEVVAYDGWATDIAKACKVDSFVRGVRNDEDYAYEKEMADYNAAHGVATRLFKTDSPISSTSAKQKMLAGDYDELPPECVAMVRQMLSLQ